MSIVSISALHLLQGVRRRAVIRYTCGKRKGEGSEKGRTNSLPEGMMRRGETRRLPFLLWVSRPRVAWTEAEANAADDTTVPEKGARRDTVLVARAASSFSTQSGRIRGRTALFVYLSGLSRTSPPPASNSVVYRSYTWSTGATNKCVADAQLKPPALFERTQMFTVRLSYSFVPLSPETFRQ